MKTKITEVVKKYKYPLLVLLLGLVLLSFPTRKTNVVPQSFAQTNSSSDELRLEQSISLLKGVGQVDVLLSENGVVIICSGANDPNVRYELCSLVSAYTGYSTDKIEIFEYGSSNKED